MLVGKVNIIELPPAVNLYLPPCTKAIELLPVSVANDNVWVCHDVANELAWYPSNDNYIYFGYTTAA